MSRALYLPGEVGMKIALFFDGVSQAIKEVNEFSLILLSNPKQVPLSNNYTNSKNLISHGEHIA